MSTEYFLGLDLTSSPKRPSAYAVLSSKPALFSLGSWSRDFEIVERVEMVRPTLIAIDAPLGLPQGLCCLEEACSCRAASPRKGRVGERELAGLGIPCYFTTKKSIIKGMVYRGIVLRKGLESRGFRVIEVYPYASKVRLFGRRIPSKATLRGLEFLRDRLASLIPGLLFQRVVLRNHDHCDAVVAAYTAYLHHRGQTEALGLPEEGQIIIPRAGVALL